MAKKITRKSDVSLAIDTKSGSRAYNRLEMQVSQTLHMAIDLYPNLNYLLVLDHYDDITIFDSDVTPATVSYFQMKTSEDAISIDTAISEAWISKLYEHLTNPEWIVSELGLITNCPLKVSVKFLGDDGKKHTEEKTYASERTDFTAFNPIAIDKIKTDIAARRGISVDEVDLTKFIHMRTTLSIPKHREIVEHEMGSFLRIQYPRITLDAVGTIYSAMMDILSRRQSYELLDKKASFVEVREKKGVSKSDFSRIIENTMLVAIPTFQEIDTLLGYEENEKYAASYEYTKLLADFQSRSESFNTIFLQTRETCLANPQKLDETTKDYCNKIYGILPSKSPIYNKGYVSVLTACVLINEWRKTQ